MNKFEIVFLIFLAFGVFVNGMVEHLVYGATSDPAEFGNSTDTTCTIGGTAGNIVCTGSGTFSSVIANVTGTSNSTDFWDNLDTPTDINAADITNDGTYILTSALPLANQTKPYCGNVTGATSNLCTITDTNTQIGNCSGLNSCGNIIYTNNGSILNVNRSNYWDNLDTPNDFTNIIASQIIQANEFSGALNWSYLQNYPAACPGSGSTQSYVSTIADSTTCTTITSLDTSNIQDVYLLNNGDVSTGNIDLDDGVGESPKLRFLNALNNISQIYEQTDGDLFIDAAKGFELAGTSYRMTTLTNCDTIDTDGSGVLSCGSDDDTTCGTSGICSTVYQSASTLDSLYVSRNAWTDHDNYPAACAGGSYASTIGDTLTCSNPATESDSTWTLHNSYPSTCAAATPFIGTIGDTSTCRGIVSDTSPQLGGYLDTNGNNLGSTTDEIENIYITTNNKIFLGTGQEGEIFYDGTKIVIKLN